MGQSNIIFSTCGGSPQGLWPGGRRVAPLHSNPFSTFKNSLQTVPDAISHAAGGPEDTSEDDCAGAARAAGSPSYERAAAVSPGAGHRRAASAG